MYLLYTVIAMMAGWGTGKGTSSLSNSTSNKGLDHGNLLLFVV